MTVAELRTWLASKPSGAFITADREIIRVVDAHGAPIAETSVFDGSNLPDDPEDRDQT